MYRYDAFGRRIAKSNQVQVSNKLNQQGRLVKHPTSLSNLSTTAKTQRETMLMLWDGNRQVQEYSKDHVFTTVYEQDSFVPVARVVWLQPHLAKNAISEKDKNWLSYFNEQVNYREQYYRNNPLERENFERKAYLEGFAEIKIYHYHTNHLGTPQELSDDKGDIVWLSYDRAWGGSFDSLYRQQFVDNWAVTENELQPFKFQGQCLDTETGLHYNRFRYYDSDVGMFIQRDPIGLLGGNNVFQYAPNPIGWIDPWGLSGVDSTGRPLSSSLYSVWYETEIPSSLHNSSRPRHFQNANKQLYEHMQKYPELKKSFPQSVVNHIQPGKRGAYSRFSPPDYTWHHNAQDPTKIQLVPRGQHEAKGAVQKTLHPDNKGGFKNLEKICTK